MKTMEIWNRLAKPETTFLKKIQAGRLKGKHDINPQWRYRALTEAFGPCGIGWKFTIERQWSADGSGGERFAFVNINLYILVDGKWSDPIPGTGGNFLIQNERNGPHNNDEAFKMATTDAIGTAAKMIGVAADVYLGEFDSKYERNGHEPATQDGTTRIGSQQLRDGFISRLRTAKTPQEAKQLGIDVGRAKSGMTPTDYEAVVQVGREVIAAFEQSEVI